MAQLQLTIALVLTGLFAVAIIGFAINFAIDNDAPINIADDPEISSLYSQQKGNLSGFSSDSESQTQSIISTTIAPESGSAQSVGPFTAIVKMITIPQSLMGVVYKEIFGGDTNNTAFKIFTNTIIALITIMIGLFLYKTLRGQPD